MSEHTSIDCDLLVLGAGMAGLSAAGHAAERGANVIVLEKAGRWGGSALLSGGVLWTATSPGRMRLHGLGRPELGEVVLRNYVEGMAWLRRRGVAMSPVVTALHGRGYQIDILDHLRGCVHRVEQGGGHVSPGTDTECLLTDAAGAVIGARTRSPDGIIDVRAKATLLATGGFQNSAELRGRYIHPHAVDRILLRSNPVSSGDGLRLGTAVGAQMRDAGGGFYGHLVSESPRWGEHHLFTLLTQYHSEYSLLLNEQGLRFCDESLGDHVDTFEVLRQRNARAICFWDAQVHEARATVPVVKGTEAVDKMKIALEHGGHGVVARTLEEVERFASAEGFDGAQLVRTVQDYNERCRSGWEMLDPPRAESFGALDRAPFHALVVRPAITATHGGLAIDEHARVLRGDGNPVPGLYAAGADAGGIYGRGYAGGLALAMTFGIEAARSAGFR
ncbi:MAG: FAD-binding protein [Steroidobacteraceae bacterium]